MSDIMIGIFRRIVMGIALVVLLVSCNEKPEEETHTYNVFLINTKGQIIPSGTVTGLSSCRYIANKRIRGDKNPGWDYYCCWVYQGNQCYQKHQ